MMLAKIKPGIVAVIIDSTEPQNIGAMVNVEHAYDGPVSDDEWRRFGWWIVLPRIPLVSDATEEQQAVLNAPETDTIGRCLVHGDSLLPLLAGARPGTVLRWDGNESGATTARQP